MDFQSSSFKRLLRPRHVVVMGGKWAEAVIISCLEMGYDGAIWPVHPNRDDIAGYPCYASIDDLPEAPDAVFLGINRHASIDMVARLAAMGAGGVVAFASGFAEVDDGSDLQTALVKAAGDMPVLGPNCYGMINYLDGALLWPDVHGGVRVDSGVAIITQSSNLSINLTMQQGGLPIAYMLTLGNQAMVGMADLIRATAEDDRVTAIGLHIEGINDAAGFADAVHFAKSMGKPIVAMKAGASEGAQMMTFSHTASLAGAHRVSRAFLKQLGIGMINDADSFIQTLGILHLGPVQHPKILTMSCSGGEASLIADTAERHGITMPTLTDAAAVPIRETVNPLVTVSNPFDYHTFDWGDLNRLTDTFTATMTAAMDMGAVCLLIIDFPSAHLGRAEDWQTALDAWLAARDATGATAAVLSSLPEGLPLQNCQWLISNNLIPLRGFDTALAALAGAYDAGLVSSYRPAGLSALSGTFDVIGEDDAKSKLAEHGITTPRRLLTQTLDDAIVFAGDQSMVMKKSGLAHKTEEGGVILGIKGADAIRSAWEKLGGHIDGNAILIEEMIDNAVAEVIVGIARDPVMGLHLVIGSGGVMTELLNDTSLVMIPATREDIDNALAATKVDTLINGFRGNPSGDRAGLINLVMKLQDYVLSEENHINEIDLNPVLVRSIGQGSAAGVVAVDALIRYAK